MPSYLVTEEKEYKINIRDIKEIVSIRIDYPKHRYALLVNNDLIVSRRSIQQISHLSHSEYIKLEVNVITCNKLDLDATVLIKNPVEIALLTNRVLDYINKYNKLYDELILTQYSAIEYEIIKEE